MDRAYWIMCRLAYWAVIALPIKSRLSLALLPYAGVVGYSNGYAEWRELANKDKPNEH